MKALVVTPSQPNSARIAERAEPVHQGNRLLVELVCMGVCGTDREIVAGEYGEAPPHANELVLGHESLGRVLEAPADGSFAKGDLVVGIVRKPDPVPCLNCAVGEWDMCRNGLYTEHGIKGLDGFGQERYLLDPAFTVKVDSRLGECGVLLEPATILAKAWEHVEAIGQRARFAPETALVMGAGPVGLLGAMMGVQRGLRVTVLDRAEGGPKVDRARALGARYISNLSQLEPAERFDVVVECTGSSALFVDALHLIGPNGVTCLTGVSKRGRQISIDAGSLNREIVLENGAVFGSVNANRRHYEKAADALARADVEWLSSLITGRSSLDDWAQAFDRDENVIKNIIVGPAHATLS